MEQSSQSKPWTDLSQNGQVTPRDDKDYPVLTNAKQSKRKLRNAHVSLSNTTTITSTTHDSQPSETVTSPALVDQLPHDEIIGQEHAALNVPDLSSLSLDVSETVTQDAGLATRAKSKYDWSRGDDEFLTADVPLVPEDKKRMTCFTNMLTYPQDKTEITQQQSSAPLPPAHLEAPPHGTDLNQIDPLAPARDNTCQPRSPTPLPPPPPPPPIEAFSPRTNLNTNDQAPARDDQEYPALTNTIPIKARLRNAHVL